MNDVISYAAELIVSPESRFKEKLASWPAVDLPETRLTLQTQGIAPLLGHKARLTGFPDSFNPQICRYLEEQAEHNSNRIKNIKVLLHKIVDIANAHEIDIIPLKGAVLIDQIYIEPAERVMSDIDLLIFPEDIKILETHLNDLGYHLSKISERHWEFDRGGQIQSLDGEHPDNPVTIELHPQINWQAGQYSSDLTDFIRRTVEKGSAALSRTNIPAKEGMFLLVLCHAARDIFNARLRLIQLYDIRLLAADTGPIEWQSLLKTAASLGIEPMAYASLYTACRLLHAQVPEPVLDQLGWQTSKRLRRQIQHQSYFSMNAANDAKTLHLRLVARPNHFTSLSLIIYRKCLGLHLRFLRLNWYDRAHAWFKAELSNKQTNSFHIKIWVKLALYLVQGLLLVFLFPFFIFGQSFRDRLLEKFRYWLLDRLSGAV